MSCLGSDTVASSACEYIKNIRISKRDLHTSCTKSSTRWMATTAAQGAAHPRKEKEAQSNLVNVGCSTGDVT